VFIKNLSSIFTTRRRWLRWSALVITLIILLIYEGLETIWMIDRSRNAWVAVDTLILVAFGAGLYLAIDFVAQYFDERNTLRKRLLEADKLLQEAHQRQKTILHITQMFADANEEEQVVDLTLRLARELIGAEGASFVSLDEHAHPLPPRVVGDLPSPATNAWIEYLASPIVRSACQTCQKQEQLTHECPLIKGTFADSEDIYCLPLRRGEQEFGVLNLYFESGTELDPDAQDMLRTLLDEAVLTLEGTRLRKRALSTMLQLQTMREKTDLDSMLQDMLGSLHETLEADYALAVVWDVGTGELTTNVQHGESPENIRPLIDGILQSVRASGEPVVLEDLSGSAIMNNGVRALMAVPLTVPEQPVVGALLVVNRRARAFGNRQLSILSTIANQAALVVQNVYLITQLEFKVIMEERTRLAREIHDGLAQTIGFLKLKTAQLRGFMEKGQTDLARQTANTCYEVLAEAYQETRRAIDGLRISPGKEGIAGWLRQASAEFEDYSGVKVDVSIEETPIHLLPEIHAQMIRIVQEALSNVRKHAQADLVEISCQELGGDVLLEIRDNGNGFDAGDISSPSQHGLRGMRERAELIGADFQVTSQPHRGTLVSVRLPQEVRENR